ncbi:carboxymuconolactone decarboxylase family protein [Variovorax paradoxus]|uniref:carboxymuconolactone decarboxylase family protein n=1 Tax=Variovorax paradoxus TaxID=34073 RepID=UPI00339B193D
MSEAPRQASTRRLATPEGPPRSPPSSHEAAADLIHRCVERSGLCMGLVGLAKLRVAQVHGCDARIDAHFLSLIDAGFSIDKLVLVADWREAGTGLRPQEQTALAWAEALARRGTTPAHDALCQEILALMGQEALVGLSLAIALENALSQPTRTPAQGGRRQRPLHQGKDQR